MVRPDLRVISAAHALLAVIAWLALWRGPMRPGFVERGPDPDVAAAFVMAVLIASALGSYAAILAGRSAWSPGRALVLDAISFAAAVWALAVLSLGPWSRDLAGVFMVAIVIVRLAPGALAVVSGRAPAWLAFVVALGGYAALAAWLPVASLPFGDQVHYLLAADRLAHGSVLYGIDGQQFAQLLGVPPSESDAATHVALSPLGPRPVQGYALALVILPGWVIFGRLGAGLIVALIAAWVSYQTLLILRDLHVGGALPPLRPPRAAAPSAGPSPQAGTRAATSGDEPASVPPWVGWTWLIASAFAPMSLLATHIYPNILGAALIATAFRWGFTAPARRPALAAALLALTLFLTPRDAVALVVLLPFLLRDPLERRRVAIAAGAVLLTAVIANGLLYGLPVPYASYFFGTLQAQQLTQQGSITAFVWVTLPAILFDRTFGMAGSAPWVFIGLIGLVPALAAERTRLAPERALVDADRPILVPAALTVGASLVALSFFRLWEGGYAPPARYFVDVLPLWTPFVAYGLAVLAMRTVGALERPTEHEEALSRKDASRRPEGLGAGPGGLTSGWAGLWGGLAGRERLTDGSWRLGRVAWWFGRAVAAVALGMSAVTSLVLSAAPSLALNTAFDDKIRSALGRILGIDPLGWLPSFQPLTSDWFVAAYARSAPAVVLTIALVWLGYRNEARTRASRRASRLVATAALSAAEVPSSPQGSVANSQGSLADPHGSIANSQGSVAKTAGALEQHPRPEARGGPLGQLGVSLVLNALATGAVILATTQPWVASGSDAVPDSLYRKWLPLSLALAALGTAFIARALPPADRAPVLRRHFALYLVPLALMLVAWAAGGPVLNGVLGAIYLVVGLAFAVHAVAALWRHVDHLTDRATALQLAAVALVVAVVLLPYHRAVMPTASDEPHYLLVTQSLVLDHDLDLANDYAGDRYSAFYPSRLPDIHGVKVGDAIYSIRDLGMPILAVVPFAIAGRLGVLALLCVVGAALAAALYLLARDLGFAPRIAFLATATTALVHPILTYTTQIYPELLTALVFVVAVRAIRWGTAATRSQLALASALLGTLPWLSTRAWPIVVGVGIVLAYAAIRPRRDLLARVAAGALPFAALVLTLSYLNWRLFGLFLPSAGYFLIREQQPVLTFAPWIGAPGLLFDRVFGLIPHAPVYLLALVGIVPLARRIRGHGAELAAVAAGSLLSFVYIADIAYWWADGSPASRYLLGSLPLFVAAVAGGWELVLGDTLPASLRAPARIAAWLTVIASAAVAYVYAVLPNIRYDLALEIAASGSSGGLFTFLGRVVGIDLGQIFPSLVRPDAPSIALVVGWALIGAILVGSGLLRERSAA